MVSARNKRIKRMQNDFGIDFVNRLIALALFSEAVCSKSMVGTEKGKKWVSALYDLSLNQTERESM